MTMNYNMKEQEVGIIECIKEQDQGAKTVIP